MTEDPEDRQRPLTDSTNRMSAIRARLECAANRGDPVPIETAFDAIAAMYHGGQDYETIMGSED